MSDPDGSSLKALLLSYGYPTEANNNHTDRWIGFDGCKNASLEAEFLEYEVISPPGFMIQTKNMTQSQMKSIMRTKGSTEAQGWELI